MNDTTMTTDEVVSELKEYIGGEFDRINAALAEMGIKVHNLGRSMEKSTSKLARINRKGEVIRDENK